MTRHRTAALAFVALLATGPVLAQTPTVTLELGRDRRDRPQLEATVVDPSGAPMTRQSVAFVLLPDFFPNHGSRINGLHAVPMGEDTTSAVGKAEVPLRPPYTGIAQFEARLLDAEGRTIASGTLETEIVAETSAMPEPIPAPLGSVRPVIEASILTVVIIVWLVLLTVLATTLRSFRLGEGGEATTGTPT